MPRDSFKTTLAVNKHGNLIRYAYGKKTSADYKRRAKLINDRISVIDTDDCIGRSNYVPMYCMVCGSFQQLTLHHIVPRCYLSNMLAYNRDINLAVICVDCHNKYEPYATQKKGFFTNHICGPNKDIGRRIVEENCKVDFYLFWLEHFLQTMKPRFIPIYWDHIYVCNTS